jgi:hypothetical protein
MGLLPVLRAAVFVVSRTLAREPVISLGDSEKVSFDHFDPAVSHVNGKKPSERIKANVDRRRIERLIPGIRPSSPWIESEKSVSSWA